MSNDQWQHGWKVAMNVKAPSIRVDDDVHDMRLVHSMNRLGVDARSHI